MKLISTLLLLASTLIAPAQMTVNFSSGPAQRDIRYVTGEPVMVGTAAIGYLEDTVWHELGVTPIREVFGQPARFADSVFSSDSSFSGRQIYLLIQAGLGTGGLYTSSNSAWVFPDIFALPPENTTSINTDQIDQALFGYFNDSHLILVPEATILEILFIALILSSVAVILRGMIKLL